MAKGRERAANAIRSDELLVSPISWLFVHSYSNFKIKIDLLYQMHGVVCSLLILQMASKSRTAAECAMSRSHSKQNHSLRCKS